MKEQRITLAHGSGGKLMHRLIKDTFLKSFNNPALAKLDDSATLDIKENKIAFTTDSYVVDPIFFNGGDIGKLAICGTVNDLSMSGATPKYISAACIIEEGFLLRDLEKILQSMVKAAKEAEVEIVAGDTKVVAKGQADDLFITTSGVGAVNYPNDLSGARIKAGDKVIVSGTVGDHGIAILSQREGLKFKTSLKSDCAPLSGLVAKLLMASKKIRALRDPTRGGLASTLNEFASVSKKCIVIEEAKVPIKKEVQGACEMLGLDPFQVANEGKVVAIVDKADANKVLQAMRNNKYGKQAQIIGEVTKEPKGKGKVLVKTPLGTTRILDMLAGEQLPRIC